MNMSRRMHERVGVGQTDAAGLLMMLLLVTDIASITCRV